MNCNFYNVSRSSRRSKTLDRIIEEQSALVIGHDSHDINYRENNNIITIASIAATPSVLYSVRHYCSVCGLLGIYTCTRCGMRYCCIRCNEHHKETRCLTFSI